jgi:putative hydrolase of the HAD superfamily
MTSTPPLRDPFDRIDTWVFDLDNTLYPADCNLFAQIDRRMAEFIELTLDCDMATARRLQKTYYAQYGTTLSGLMSEHGVAPETFMDFVHDIDLSGVQQDADLRIGIESLPGRRYIFTNGSARHAENVAGHLGLLDAFDGVFDIASAGYEPKPRNTAYEAFLGAFAIKPSATAMFEDMPQNLEVPFAVGMRTVLVQTAALWCADEPVGKRPSRPGERFAHVHHVTDDLTDFLRELTTRPPPTDPKGAPG